MKQNLTKIKLVVAIVATTIMLTACNSNYEKTASGMAYKISHGSGKEKIKQGQIVKFYIEYKLQDKDTILNTNYGKMPGYLPVDTSKLPKHNFTEIITKLTVGDKVDFILSIDTLKSLGQIPNYDNIFKKGGLIKGKVEILKVFANDSLTQPDYQAEAKKEEARQNLAMQKEMKEREAKNKVLIVDQKKALKEYAAKNNIKCIESPLGVLVEVQNPGVGMKAENGTKAMILYTGKLMDGKQFDSNVGRNPEQLLPVLVGSHNVVPGMEDAMQYFAKGGKGRLLIPAALAYGDREAGPIPANSNLIFEIEVKDVVSDKPVAADTSKTKR
jgi:FKBP-type peptidyl-prolyl cis-trans isomerase FkpA